MMRKYKTLNFGVPSSGSVNVFEFLQCDASEKVKMSLTKEDYDSANILDRRFKDGPRKSPLFEWQGLDWIWGDDFSIQSYMNVTIARIDAEFTANPQLKQDQIKHGKLELVSQKTGQNVEELLVEAIQGLVYFDARCAEAIRETMSFEDFVALHQSAEHVVANTINSIVEELKEESECIFFLQELNGEVIERLTNAIMPDFQIEFNEQLTTAIIYPTSCLGNTGKVVEGMSFITLGDTFLHEEVCVLKVDNVIYISAHFSSKKKMDSFKENKTPHKNMDDQLFVLKYFITQMTAEGFKVVVGGDFNQRLTEDSIGTHRLFPKIDTPTTCKERSGMQVQFKKINKKDSGSKDGIVIFSGEEGEEIDCRVRSLYKNGKSYCSYAQNAERAALDDSLIYPIRLQYPDYTLHFPDHDLVEVINLKSNPLQPI